MTTSRVPPTNVLLLTFTLHDLSTAAIAPLVSGTLLPVIVNRSTLSALNATVDWGVSELLPLKVMFRGRKFRWHLVTDCSFKPLTNHPIVGKGYVTDRRTFDY